MQHRVTPPLTRPRPGQSAGRRASSRGRSTARPAGDHSRLTPSARTRTDCPLWLNIASSSAVVHGTCDRSKCRSRAGNLSRLMGYKVSSWVNFGVVLGPVAGALVGLLFVAVSVRANELAASRSLTRAAQTLLLLGTSIVVALALVAPQPDVALGLELLGWAILSAALMVGLNRRAGDQSADRAARYVERFAPNTATSALLAIAGATFLAKHGGGLYWLLPAIGLSLLSGLISAWLFLIPDS